MSEMKIGSIWIATAIISICVLASAFLVSSSINNLSSEISSGMKETKSLLLSMSLKPIDSGATGGAKDLPVPTVIATTTPKATAIPSIGKINVDGKPVRGTPGAKVQIVEFSDFQCPYCGAAEPAVLQVLKEYAGKVSLVYLNFPLSFHPYAEKAAEAYECALVQGKSWEYHDVLFANQNALDVQSLKKHASDLKLDSAKFDSCLDGGSKKAVVDADTQKGSSLGVSGTPTFFINGKMLVGAQPYSAFKQVIDAELSG